MRIVFMGTPEFAVPSLEALIRSEYRPTAVVTAPDRARGRGRKKSPTPVKTVALREGILVLEPESVKDPGFAEQISGLDPEIIVVVAFRILPPEVFKTARLGSFNLHASLLPAFRGAAPINRAIMAGATETGVTTFFLREKVDTGNIILQKRVAIGENETAGELHDRLMLIGAEAVVETVKQIALGAAKAIPQDDHLATPANKIFPADCRIPWHLPARVVHDHVRGLSPSPGAWTTHSGKLLKILRTERVNGEGKPGLVTEAGHELIIACGDGAVRILELQQEGRRRLSAGQFLLGYPLRPGDILI